MQQPVSGPKGDFQDATDRTKGRADTAPTPISTVPFSRNPNFVEREEWHTLNNKLASNASYATKIALVGLGGSGYVQHLQMRSWRDN